MSHESGTAMQKQLLIRLVVTALVAWLIAVVVSVPFSSHGTSSVVWIWIVCSVTLYWLWKWGDGKTTNRPFWWTVLRRIIILVAGAVALIVFMAPVMMIHDLRYSETQVSTERNKVRIGMTINDVLALVHGDVGIRAHAELPDNIDDEQLVHYANLVQQRDGTFSCTCGMGKELRYLTAAQAAERMKQKMSDGYEWRWRYTFLTSTPRHYSFTVTFGRDGRVKGITDVWGWD
jgi:hypothetical protein